MKPIILLSLLLAAPIILDAQMGRFNIGLEYSYAFSRVTEPRFHPFNTRGFYPSGNIFIKGDYTIMKNMDITLGAGYLVTKEMDKLPFGLLPDTDLTEIYSTHEYFVIPAGIKYHFGSFYIHPELGLAFQERHLIENISYTINQNSTQISGTIFESQLTTYNRITIPVFLTIGNEIDLGKIKLLLGIKSYYSMNSIYTVPLRPSRYYGFGVMAGVSF